MSISINKDNVIKVVLTPKKRSSYKLTEKKGERVPFWSSPISFLFRDTFKEDLWSNGIYHMDRHEIESSEKYSLEGDEVYVNPSIEIFYDRYNSEMYYCDDEREAEEVYKQLTSKNSLFEIVK